MTHDFAPSSHERLRVEVSDSTIPEAVGDPTLIDCDACSVRGTGCGDCVVTFLIGEPPAGVTLNEEERRAVEVLAAAGLVPPLRLVQSLASVEIDPP
jgi:hypothetical protein